MPDSLAARAIAGLCGSALGWYVGIPLARRVVRFIEWFFEGR